jgi:hypothetical protein
MDGVIVYTNATTGNTITIRSGVQETPTPTNRRTARVTGYQQYWDTEYKARIIDEQCDNGGDEDHGCDRLCQIVSGWECFHYYHHILGVETPYFTSICQETAYKTLSRRLSPDDFDREGRFLSHKPRKAYLYKLPTNTHEMRAGKHTLKLDPKNGLNGQVRILESTTCASCFGFTMAYQRDAATDADYWYYQVSDSTATAAPWKTSDVEMTANSNAMQGKQRNTFGAYMVVNKDFDELEVYGYALVASASFTKLYTTTAEASVEYLGAHEFHWFPYKNLLMAKLSDGSSFRFFRMTSDFRTVAAAGDGSQ